LNDNQIVKLAISSDCLNSDLPKEIEKILSNKQLDEQLYTFRKDKEYKDIVDLLLKRQEESL
jgi:hypothetical protein